MCLISGTSRPILNAIVAITMRKESSIEQNDEMMFFSTFSCVQLVYVSTTLYFERFEGTPTGIVKLSCK